MLGAWQRAAHIAAVRYDYGGLKASGSIDAELDDLRAPRGAQLYSPLSGHGLEEVSLDLMGPLGQSIIATGNLAGVAGLVLPRPYSAGTAVLALLYGLPAWGFAMLWRALAAAFTVRTVRRGMPLALTWWAFTFPVGNCVTGAISLAARAQSMSFRVKSRVVVRAAGDRMSAGRRADGKGPLDAVDAQLTPMIPDRRQT